MSPLARTSTFVAVGTFALALGLFILAMWAIS